MADWDIDEALNEFQANKAFSDAGLEEKPKAWPKAGPMEKKAMANQEPTPPPRQPKKEESPFDYLLREAGVSIENFMNPTRPVGNMAASLASRPEVAQAGSDVIGGIDRTLGSGAIVGRRVNEAVQSSIESMVEGAGYLNPSLGAAAAGVGTAVGSVAEAAIPQDKLSVALAPLQAAGMGKQAVVRFGEKPLKKAGALAKTAGAAAAITSGVSQKRLAAAIANPEIIIQAPTMKEVSSEYAAVFQRIGKKFDSDTINRYLDKFYIPGDSEAGTLNNKVYALYKKAQKGEKLAPEEAFLGRSMAAAMERTDRAGRNASFKQFAAEAKNKFDEVLENSGMPEIKQLSRRYFAAATREELESLFPKNKNMSPNALRGVLMLKMAMEGFAEKSPQKLVGSAAMSPAIVGELIGALNPPGKKYLATGSVAAQAEIRRRKDAKKK